MSAKALPGHTELAPDFFGRRLGLRFSHGFGNATRALRPGEALYVLHDQLIKKVPVLVEDQAGFNDNERDHSMGLSIRYELVAGAALTKVTVISQPDDSDEITIQSFHM